MVTKNLQAQIDEARGIKPGASQKSRGMSYLDNPLLLKAYCVEEDPDPAHANDEWPRLFLELPKNQDLITSKNGRTLSVLRREFQNVHHGNSRIILHLGVDKKSEPMY